MLRTDHNLLTGKQENVLRFIQERISKQGIPPTIREIAAQFGFSSTGTVRDYLKALAKKGYLRITSKKSRYIELIKKVGLDIPILGRVPAGGPELVYEYVDGYINLDEFSKSSEIGIFALRVKGDSMIEVGIFENDLVLVRSQKLARDREIVVALLEGEATVKRFRQRRSRAWLEPANERYDNINKEFSLIGKVIGVIRKYV